MSIIYRLINVTPELTEDQRRAFFGDRSENEQSQLADMFMDCTHQQREIVYDTLRAWCADYARLN